MFLEDRIIPGFLSRSLFPARRRPLAVVIGPAYWWHGRTLILRSPRNISEIIPDCTASHPEDISISAALRTFMNSLHKGGLISSMDTS
jgi:hypothetical protein